MYYDFVSDAAIPTALPKALTAQTSTLHARKLPSYAPQNSSEAKVTVDYKELLRGCKSYKSPGKDVKSNVNAKPNNIFDKFSSNQLKPQQKLESKPHPVADVKKAYSTSSSRSDRRQHEHSKPRQNRPDPALEKQRSSVTIPNLSNYDSSSNKPAELREKQKRIKSEQLKSVQLKSDKLKVMNMTDKPTLSKPAQPNLFDRIGMSSKEKLKRPAELLNGNGSCSPKTPKLPKYNGSYFADEEDTESDMVYKPGVGIMPSASNHRKEVPKKKEEKIKLAELNSSLDFHDPYADDYIPKATSPTRADLNQTFSIGYSPFKAVKGPLKQPDDEQDARAVASSQESSSGNRSLVIEDTTASSEEDDDDEVDSLPEDEPTAIELSPSPKKSQIVKPKVEEIEVIELEEIDCIELKPPRPPKKESPPRRPSWLDNLQSNKDIDEKIAKEVFGGSNNSSPVKFKKTFQKKKPSSEAIKLDKDQEEEYITKMYSKDLEDQKSLLEESLNTTISTQNDSGGESSDDGSRNTSSTKLTQDSDDNAEANREIEKKLEEIKELKAKIFIKQHKQNQNEASSSSDSSSESSSDESTTSKHDTDSDFSIDSNKSVNESASSSSSSADTVTSPSGDSQKSSPKRKRKRYRSPDHNEVDDNEFCDIKPTMQPILNLTPKEIKLERRQKRKEQESLDRRKKRAERKEREKKRERSDLQTQPSLKNRHTIQVGIDAPSNSMKRKKTDVEEAEKLKRKRRHEEEKDKQRRKKHEEHKKRKALKPGVNHNIQSDKIIPHQKKLSDRKQKIMEQYDQRMHTDSNSSSFYQKNTPDAKASKSKFKKEVKL